MDLTVLNTNTLKIANIDVYESLIWTDRYSKCGDFELCLPITGSIPWYLQQENMIINNQSEHVMIIETIETISDAETGNHLKVSGRSLESILDRRIIWGQQSFNGNLQNGIETLLNSCFISPTDEKRKVERFIFKPSTDPAITELTFEAQYCGDNLLDVIEKLCSDYGLGYKITLDCDLRQFIFELYVGTDRSYGQMENPYVVFSPEFETIINSNFLESSTNYKNVVLVAGSGEGANRKTATVGSDTVVGLGRREVYVEASDVSQDTTSAEYEVEDATQPNSGKPTGIYQLSGLYVVGESTRDAYYETPAGVTVKNYGETTLHFLESIPPPGTPLGDEDVSAASDDGISVASDDGIAVASDDGVSVVSEGALTDEEYKTLLIERGGECLLEHSFTFAFEGQIDTSRLYKYREDFFNGDIVQFANEYGHEVKVRILEIVMSVDKEGFLIYPTFSVINEEGDTSE